MVICEGVGGFVVSTRGGIEGDEEVRGKRGKVKREEVDKDEFSQNLRKERENSQGSGRRQKKKKLLNLV